MRRHKMVLEVEFLVGASEDVKTAAKAVAESIYEHVDAGDDSLACVVGVPRIVSFNKRPLPQTKQEIKEDRAEAKAEAKQKAAIAKFIKETPLQTYFGFHAFGHAEFLGTLQAVSASHITVLDRHGVKKDFLRDEIYEMWDEDLDCAHGRSRMSSKVCTKCAKIVAAEKAEAARVDALCVLCEGTGKADAVTSRRRGAS